MASKKKVLITGGSGLLASSAWLHMQDAWEMVFSVRSAARAPRGQRFVECALDEERKVREMLETEQPDLVLHAAGLTSVEECEAHKYRAHVSNVLSSRIVAREAQSLGCRLIHISTDHFSSDHNASNEEEIGFPQNNYALTKLAAEYEVQAQHTGALIARTNFFSWGLPHRRTFFDQIVDHLRTDRTVGGFTDVTFNPLSAPVLLRYLEALDSKGWKGIFNLTGDEVLTKYAFAVSVAHSLKLNSRLIKETKVQSSTSLVKRPRNLGLSNSKLKESLGLERTPSMSEMIAELIKSEKSDKERISFAYSETPPKLISYGRQSILDSDFESVISAVGNDYLTQGPKVQEFEKTVASIVGAKYAVAMCNWTAGLHMAILAADVGPGDNIITSPITFVASSNCAIYAGATPHFADIDPETLNISPESVEELCRKLGKVKAIIPVHFAGAPCDMKSLREIADRFGAVLIEDAAHAIGGSYLTGERIGNPKYSSMIGFSFHPVKNVTTGEGGMITTNDPRIYQRLLRLRSHGITKGSDPFMEPSQAYTNGVQNPWYYEMQEIGYNYRITDLQCALGLSQIARLESMHARRVQIGEAYDRAFSELPNVIIRQSSTRRISGNHLYVVELNYKALEKNRNEVFQRLRAQGIGVHVHYIPVYRQPYYKSIVNQSPESWPSAESYYQGALTLPLYAGMSDSDVSKVIEAIRGVVI